MRFCKPVVLVVALASIAFVGGCLTVPLGDPEKSKVDDSYIGFWVNSRPDGDDGKLLSVQAFDARTYLITQYSFKQTANGVEPNGVRVVQKAWLTQVQNATFVTLERMDAGRVLRKDDKPYSVARVSLEGSILSTRPVNPTFVNEKQVKNPDDMMKLVTTNLNNDKMYSDAEVYEKISAERFSEVKDILAAFGEENE